MQPHEDEALLRARRYASAALRGGVKAAQVAASLVEKGLTADQAAAVIDRCLESNLKSRGGWLHWSARLASLAIAGGLVGLAFAKRGWNGALLVAIAVLLPLCCIWFSEPLGSYVGPTYLSGRGYVNRPTPGCLVALAGWFFLVGVPLLLFWLSR